MAVGGHHHLHSLPPKWQASISPKKPPRIASKHLEAQCGSWCIVPIQWGGGGGGTRTPSSCGSSPQRWGTEVGDMGAQSGATVEGGRGDIRSDSYRLRPKWIMSALDRLCSSGPHIQSIVIVCDCSVHLSPFLWSHAAGLAWSWLRNEHMFSFLPCGRAPVQTGGIGPRDL